MEVKIDKFISNFPNFPCQILNIESSFFFDQFCSQILGFNEVIKVFENMRYFSSNMF